MTKIEELQAAFDAADVAVQHAAQIENELETIRDARWDELSTQLELEADVRTAQIDVDVAQAKLSAAQSALAAAERAAHPTPEPVPPV